MGNRRALLLTRFAAGALLALALWGASAGAAPTVVLVLAERGGVYDEVASAMQRELRGVDVVTIAEDALSHVPARSAVIAAVGTAACQRAVQASARAPVLCTLLPRSAFKRVLPATAERRAVSAIVLDQPLARQLALVELVLPEAREVGVLLGKESAAIEPQLLQAVRARGMRLASAQVRGPDELYARLNGILGTADVLLAVPDSAVFNSGTTQNILRAAFHARVPMVAFSPGYVRAGALAAVFSTPGQIGSQAAHSVRELLAGRAVPPVQSPRDFEVSINDHVARALGLQLDEVSIAKKLRRMEGAG